jgi:glycosyltransferase involved in cell wall biosynthesis
MVPHARGRQEVRVGFAYNFNDRDWTGGKNYFSSLFRAVHEVSRGEIELVLVTGTRNSTTLPDELPFLEVLRTRLLDRLSLPWALRRIRSELSRDGDPAFADLLRRNRVDVLSHSWGLAGSGIKTLGWLPDFQFLHLPDYWDPGRLRSTRRMYQAICRGCDALLVSSRDAMGDLMSFAPTCTAPVHVLPFVSAAVDLGRLQSKDALCAQYGLPSTYFLLPNQFWAHKNHRVAIDALAILKGQGNGATLVCTGHTGDFRRPEYFQELMSYCRAAGVIDEFRVLGLIPYPDVQGLMAHARAIVNPSRFEGWSTTVEEAKTLGRRVLLSDIPVHREQAPTNAGYFECDDPKALASLLRESLDSTPPEPSAAEILANYGERLRAFGSGYLAILDRISCR